MSDIRDISIDELKIHNKANDCWIAVHGRVFDVTKFLADHPGGGEVISSLAGSDVTAEFEDIGHSDGARNDARKYFIGYLATEKDRNSSNIPLLKDLSRKTVPGLDTRLIVFAAFVAVAAAVASFQVLKK